MNKAQHFHLAYSLKFIQKSLIVCLIPLIKALLDFDLASLYTALVQELALVVGLAVAAWLVWLCSSWQLENGVLTLRSGIFLRRSRTLTPSQIAVVEQHRTVPLRLVGATRVTVYLAKGATLPKATFYLKRKQASTLAEELMPCGAATSFFRPTGAQRLSLVMLSANLMTTAALAWFTLRQTRITLGEVLPENWRMFSTMTLQNLTFLERIIERFLPAGIAWIFTALLVLSCLSLVVSLLRTARFAVSRHGGVILSEGGLFTLTQTRVRAGTVTLCDVRITLAARILRRYPVYLCAGSYNGGAIPVLVYGRGQERLLEQLMPEFRIPSPADRPARTSGRSLPAFLGIPGTLLLCSWVMFCVAGWRLPALAPFFLLLTLVLLVLCFVQAQAFFIEDAWSASSGVLTVRYVRGFTLHNVCVFTHDVSFGTFQTPFSESRGRCTLRLRMPFHRLVRVRSMELFRAQQLQLPIG